MSFATFLSIRSISRFALTTVAFLSAALLASNVLAEQEKPPKYQIDMVIFEHLALKGWTEEYWPEEVTSLELEGAIDFAHLQQPPLELEIAEETLLENEVARVAKNYRLLEHRSWIQNALEPQQTPKVFFEGETPTNRYYGTVKMYQSRYNHVAVELSFERMIPGKVRSGFARMQRISDEDLPQFWPFHLQAQRKLKSGELHYIDHPLFGILIQIQKLEPELK